ncbi:alpha/beta hydrolase family protein [Aeoliella mucimassa]|uniref:FecR protein n=1 Tax=Aeoliella mucimassa TaxID=2527972 RepID=A0A518APJ7_9BACT|nr:alpha/beta hydrolase family protein [Aeoliella mucimassa]QDU56653.1 FecR protein [Aeoliella mucimassa]
MTSPSDNSRPADLTKLFELLVDDPLDASTRKQLELELLADAQHRQAYVEQVLIHTSLQWQYKQPASCDFESEQIHGDASSIDASTKHSRWSFRSIGLTVLAASLLFVAGLAALWQSRSAPTLATVSGANNVTFASSDPQIVVGQQLSKQVVSIESGELELVFSSGATVLLGGRTEVELVSPLLMKLNHGQVTSTVSEGAIGFKVITPNLDVVDLGTEFGVEVDAQGGTDVVVFSGQVRLERDSKALVNVGLLTEGQGVRVDQNQQVERIGHIGRESHSRGWVAKPTQNQPTASSHVIAVVWDNMRITECKDFYEVLYRGFEEDARAYVDRVHEWNGIDQGGLPNQLLGGDYIRPFNNDKYKDDYELSVTLAKPCYLYVLWDSRCDPQPWLLQQFRETEMQVALDEGPLPPDSFNQLGIGPGNELDQEHTVWVMEVAEPRTVVLGPVRSAYLGVQRSMYGVVAKAMSNQELDKLAAQRSALASTRQDQIPSDHRLEKLRSYEHPDYSFTPPSSLEEWKQRREQVKRSILVATGLWPMPEQTPAHAQVYGKVERPGYTIEKVHFESYPGHLVTGNLYRPKDGKGPYPGVLCPHGHWTNGRFMQLSEAEMAEALETGQEQHDVSGRYPLQARCVQLARMGCVVFHYDMVGYADSNQLSHRSGIRGNPSRDDGWGMASPQAELRLQNEMGVQTYNSLRALDWLTSLEDVDAERIGVTGASGGGTQTFILCAIDERPTVALPAVMVSTGMQGGCTCENAPYLRIESGNVEFAGLMAPRPLGLLTADDWTRTLLEDGYPQLQQIYRLYGKEQAVKAWAYPQFPHNYNYVSRGAMYEWFNQHLNLQQETPIVEGPFEPLTVNEMSVWTEEHPAPPPVDNYQGKLLAQMWQQTHEQIAKVLPTDAESLDEFRQLIGGGWQVILGRDVPGTGVVRPVDQRDTTADQHTVSLMLLHNTEHSEQVPALMLTPETSSGRLALWISRQGKQSVYSNGSLASEVQQLLDNGVTVLAIDLYGQGDFTPDGRSISRQRYQAAYDLPPNGSFSGYMYGYNHPLFCQRVHDILTAIAYARDLNPSKQPIYLVGMHGAGHWVAAARSQAGELVQRAVIDAGDFDFGQVTSVVAPDFVPGSVKYLGLPGLMALGAPYDTCLITNHADSDKWKLVQDAYRSSRASESLKVISDPSDEGNQQAIDWLLRDLAP